ncbi:hypothetical protein ABVK25_000034 [Lepraria finkii]|uniref:AAA+ ATPase domain-containing protein n=1 Tax=Lepraria finkii TaxID=1340010 RepID=A0ABR4BM10_9LECA
MAPTEISPKPSASPQPPATPPGSPTSMPFPQSVAVEDLKRLVVWLVKEAQNAESADKVQTTALEGEKDVQPAESRARASRLEYKTIDERWNEKTGRYETVESSPPGEVEGLDEYVFVARAWIDNKPSDPVFYIDVKSDKLRDILRTVLQDVHGVSLREDKPAVDRNLLYHYLPELEAYGTKMSDDVGQEQRQGAQQDDGSPTCAGGVLAISYGFAVDDISPIVWNPSSFANLAILPQIKNLVLALAKAHLGETSDHAFDDFVVGKGRGLILLLHGPPGVGKTLTAEGLSEYLKRPLYAISAEELGHDPKTLEEQLSHTSQPAHHWKALVLLDEADVFVQARSIDSQQNARVSVFLRKLEYNQGIMFLTTNRVRDFDDAIQSRITLALRYEPLSLATRKQIWVSFLKKAVTVNGAAKVDQKGLDRLAGKHINGRQIKNMVAAAYALAVHQNTEVSMSHLEVVTGLSEEFESDFGKDSNKHSYL